MAHSPALCKKLTSLASALSDQIRMKIPFWIGSPRRICSAERTGWKWGFRFVKICLTLPVDFPKTPSTRWDRFRTLSCLSGHLHCQKRLVLQFQTFVSLWKSSKNKIAAHYVLKERFQIVVYGAACHIHVVFLLRVPQGLFGRTLVV